MTKKNKFKFNPEALNYSKVETGLTPTFFKNLLTIIAASIVLALLLFIAYSYFLNSPAERRLQRENAFLQKHYQKQNEEFKQTAKVLEDLQRRDTNIYRAIFETDPVTYSYASKSNIHAYNKFDGLTNLDIAKQTNLKLDSIVNKISGERDKYQSILKLVNQNLKKLSHIPAIQPVEEDELTRYGSSFGVRIHPLYKVPKMHYGVDFIAPKGTKIIATADGTIEESKQGRGHGEYIVINHGFGYKTLYAHLSKRIVRRGKKVKRGDVIGFVGESGMGATNPLLFYQVIKDGKAVNPINYYFKNQTPHEYQKMIQIAKNSN